MANMITPVLDLGAPARERVARMAQLEREYERRAHHGRDCLNPTYCAASGGVGAGCRNTHTRKD